MKRLISSTLFGQQSTRRDPTQVKARGSSKAEAEAAAWCSMKLAEAERQARDGRKSVCCG